MMQILLFQKSHDKSLKEMKVRNTNVNRIMSRIKKQRNKPPSRSKKRNDHMMMNPRNRNCRCGTGARRNNQHLEIFGKKMHVGPDKDQEYNHIKKLSIHMKKTH